MNPIANQFNMHKALFEHIVNSSRPHHIPVTQVQELYIVPVHGMSRIDRQDFEDQMEQEGRDMEHDDE